MLAYVMEAPGVGGVREVPEPEAGDYDATVEMVACGICSSTDKMLRQGTFRGGVSFPSILGHESVGRVVSVGARVRNLRPGQLITRASAYSPYAAPLEMYWGGFAERGVVTDWAALRDDDPDTGLAPRFDQRVFEEGPDPLSIAVGISLSETFSVAVRHDVVGKTVAVTGTGIAGLSFMAYARLLGAARVIGVGRRQARLELAARAGADVTALTDDVDGLARELGGIDVVFEASGQAEMVGRAYDWLKPAGKLVIYSAPEATASLDLMAGPRDATVEVASTHETAVLPGIVSMVEGGALDRELFLTHSYAFADIAEAFDEIGRGSVVKAVVTFG
jgi:2-desacetyl-2-hydroxyethyl bacteriochlorophyllide A dehydrogenase